MRSLIIGIDGGIGAALAAHVATTGGEVRGTSRHPNGRPGVLALDLAHLDDTPAWPEADVVYLCAALTQQAQCRADPALSRRVNQEAPCRLARHYRDHGARVVFLSSTAVFDGRQPYRREDAPPAPRTAYGQDKADAEQVLLDLGGCAVVRLTKVLTARLPLFTGWIEALRAGNTVRPFHDMGIAPLPLDCVVETLQTLGEGRDDGVFHLSGARDIAYADAARHIAARLDADPALVQPWSRKAAGIADSDVQEHTVLACDRLASLLRFIPPEPTDVIDLVFGLR